MTVWDMTVWDYESQFNKYLKMKIIRINNVKYYLFTDNTNPTRIQHGHVLLMDNTNLTRTRHKIFVFLTGRPDEDTNPISSYPNPLISCQFVSCYRVVSKIASPNRDKQKRKEDTYLRGSPTLLATSTGGNGEQILFSVFSDYGYRFHISD